MTPLYPEWASQVALVVKNLPANAGDTGLIPGMGRSTGGGGGTSLQYSCLENPMDRGTWQAIVYRVAKSQIQLSSLQTWYEFDPGPCYLILLATCSLL